MRTIELLSRLNYSVKSNFHPDAFLSFDFIFFLRLVCKVKSVKAEFCVSSPCIKKMKCHLQKYRKMSLFSVIYGLKKMVMWKKTDCTYSESVSMSKSSKKALC